MTLTACSFLNANCKTSTGGEYFAILDEQYRIWTGATDDLQLQQSVVCDFDPGGERFIYASKERLCVGASFIRNSLCIVDPAINKIVTRVEIPKPQILRYSSVHDQLICVSETHGAIWLNMHAEILRTESGVKEMFVCRQTGKYLLSKGGANSCFDVYGPSGEHLFQGKKMFFGMNGVLFYEDFVAISYPGLGIVLHRFDGSVIIATPPIEPGIPQWLRLQPGSDRVLVHLLAPSRSFLVYSCVLESADWVLLGEFGNRYGKLIASPSGKYGLSTLGELFDLQFAKRIGLLEESTT